MLTRRRFLLTLPAFAAAPQLLRPTAEAQVASFTQRFRRKPVPPTPSFIYFGTDTNPGISKGIYVSRFDPATGAVTPPVLAAATLRPSFLALSPASITGKRFLYAVNAVNAPTATVSSFAIDPATGALRPLNQVTSAGAGPAYIAVDDSGRTAFVANYFGSSIATYRIQPDGSLSQPVTRLDFKDPKFGKRGPNAGRQDIPHPHATTLSPDNRFVLVNDLGSDAISVFSFDPATAQLSAPALFEARPGSGPRHMVFHPNGRWIYSINEIDSTIDHFLWTTTSSRTAPQGLLVNAGTPIKTIDPSFPAAKNTAAEVAVSPDGRFLYASNRGEDTLVAFTIAPETGALTLLQRISCGGKTPRQFALSPESDSHWLICGNEDSATVTTFRRDGGTGKLSGPVQTIPLDSPMFALFA
jgi:6-phosphogluconolactonase